MQDEKQRINFAETRGKIMEFIENYNLDKKTGEKLRRAHYELLLDLVRIYNREITQQRHRSINENDLVKTNNVELSKRLMSSRTTIYRQMHRCVVSGILHKVNHGSLADYEVYFKAPVLVFSDSVLSDNQYKIADCVPNTEYPKNVIKRNNDCEKGADATLPTDMLQRTFFKGADATLPKNSFRGTESLGATGCLKNPYQTQSIGAIAAKIFSGAGREIQFSPVPDHQIQQNSRCPQSDYGKKVKRIESEIEMYAFSAAKALVSEYITRVLPKSMIVYDHENENSVNYVYENYYQHLKSFDLIKNEYELHRKRLQFTIKYAEKRASYRPPFPLRFFDIDNRSNGFKNTEKWLKKANDWKQIKENRRKYKSANEKLLRAIATVKANPTIENYNRAENYIKKALPAMLPTFQQAFISN